ncbi:hypothetical protein LAZ40_05105 [Cereibacter sphaeroides]|uniref:hypothetical protein n=1 Tax=Cereibacter sphaeroides TaxID=1063 RepID=UPI001F3DFECB|nr:hypothetical protein [Cereibacter sphaeroides]MCE6958434.1 hypothetical protein [Cereibacter sphaeroides]MCE6972639.1 hypothetical protein [Cereibacter sphaeroides]
MAIDPDITPLLDALSTQVANIEGQATDLATRIDAVKAELLSLEDHAAEESAALLARLAALESALPAVADTSQSSDTALAGRIDSLSASSTAGDAALCDRLDTVQNEMGSLGARLTEALSRLTKLEGGGAPVTADLFDDETAAAPVGWTQGWHPLDWIETGGAIRSQPANTSRTLLSCDALGTATDVETLALFGFADAGGYGGLAMRASGAATSESGYRVMFNNNGSGPSMQVVRFNAGTATILSNLAFARAAAGDYWLRMRLNGPTLSWKAWPASENEPAAWTGTVTDGSPIVTAGRCGVTAGCGASAATTVKVQQFSWALDGAAAAPAPVTVTTVSPPTPSVPPAAVEPKPWERIGTLPMPVVAFDDEATKTIYVPPGRYAHIKVSASSDIKATAYLRPWVSNATGGNINVGSNQDLWVGPYWCTWRPGDDRDLWLTIDMQYVRSAGRKFSFTFHTDMGGWATASPITGYVEIREGAVNALPAVMPYHRPPMQLTFTGAPTVSLDPASITWSDSGYVGNASSGTPCWMSRLSHGYTQDGNGEVGLYLNDDAFPGVAQTPHMKGTDQQGRPFVRLRSERLVAPHVFQDTRLFYHQASALVAQRLPAWRGKTGVWSARCMTSSRMYSWPAFWLLGDGWPPEFDIFEHFNGIYGSWPDGSWSTSTAHSGPFGSLTVMNRHPLKFDLNKLGFSTFDAYTEIHDYAAYVDRDWIYSFIDGVEVFCCPNIARHENWDANWSLYPMFDVAAKFANPSTYPYSDGSGDMYIYGATKHETTAAALVPFTEARPWVNRKIAPDPTF